MTNREHIAKILTREVSTQEKHQAHMTPEEIRVREALDFLAASIDNLEARERSRRVYEDRY